MKFSITRAFYLQSIAAISIVTNAPIASAAWVSSGESIRADAANPWWLSNTHAVNYCVMVDTATVSVSEEKAAQLLGDAISYWRTEFGRESTTSQYSLATQRFTRVACDDTVQVPALRVQIGPGTLSDTQREYFAERLPEVFGIAVRTDYDEVNLRGQGFIYIRDDATTSVDAHHGNTNFRAWSHDQRLLRVMIHELGHVFGLPNIPGTLMDQGGPEYWFTESLFDDRANSVPHFAGMDLSNETCFLTRVNITYMGAYFGLPAEADTCLVVNVDMVAHRGTISAGRPNYPPYLPIKQIGTFAIPYGSFGGTGNHLVKIRLNPHQVVFNTSELEVYGDMDEWNTRLEEIVYEPIVGYPKPMKISRTLTTFNVSGVVKTNRGLVMISLLDLRRRFGDWVY